MIQKAHFRLVLFAYWWRSSSCTSKHIQFRAVRRKPANKISGGPIMRLRCEAHGKCAHWFLASVALRRKSLKAQSSADISALFLNTEGTWRRCCVDQSASLRLLPASKDKHANMHLFLLQGCWLALVVLYLLSVLSSFLVWIGLDFFMSRLAGFTPSSQAERRWNFRGFSWWVVPGGESHRIP